MRLEIRMPRMSEFSDEGVIKKWRVAVGAVVKKGEALADVDVDMSITTIKAQYSGKIAEIWVNAGQPVPVETVIAMQVVDQSVIEEESAAEEPQQEEAVEEKPADEYDIFPELGDETNPYVDPDTATSTGVQYGQVLASPEAIELAVLHNVNIETMIGTGTCGQIERADVEAAMQANSRFVTSEDIDDLMSFDGDFASKLPSDEPAPAPAPEAENVVETVAGGQAEAAQTWPENNTTQEEPNESSATQIKVSTAEPAPLPTENAEMSAKEVSTPEVIYMGAGPAPADDLAAIAVNESDTIKSDENLNSEFAVNEEQDTSPEPVKLDEETVSQVIEQSVTQPLRKPVRLRRLVARKMQQSWQQAPHFFVTVAVDMTDVIRFRSDLGVTINDFILTATTRSLQEHPWVNSHFVDDEAMEQSAINISMAVETEQGLYYPVIKDCTGKSVKQLGIASAEMVVKAHSGKLSEEDMADGGFTISNMGMLGVESFSAIITPPQVAVLAVGTVRGEVILDENEEMSMAPMVRLTLSGDHRALDGADAADFLGTMKSYLEAPITLVAPQDDI